MTISTNAFTSYQGSLLQESVNNCKLGSLYNLRRYVLKTIKRRAGDKHKTMFLRECVEHINSIVKATHEECWVKNLQQYRPNKLGHWPNYHAGFNLSKSGKIWLTDNEPKTIHEPNKCGLLSPCHRDLISGQGIDKTIYSGLYSFKPNDQPALYLYPDTVIALNSNMKRALCSLVGVDKITDETNVYSNSPRYRLFALKDV